MKFLKYTLVVICCHFAYLERAQSSEPKLFLLVEDNQPHAGENAQTGEIQGTEVDIIVSLMKGAGIEYDMTITPWNRAFRRAQTEQNTCVFPINYTTERASLFQWINPTQVGGGWVIYQRPESNILIEKIEDIGAHTIVGKMGTQANDRIEAITGQRVLVAATDIAAVQLLYRGRADLLISGTYDNRIAAKNAGLPVPKAAFNWMPAQFGLACSMTTDVSVIDALRQVNKERLAKLQQQ